MRIGRRLVDAHALKRLDPVRIHRDGALILHERVVQVLLVRQPDFGMRLHGTAVHRLEHDRVRRVLKLDLKPQILLDDHLQNVRLGTHRRPVRNTNHDIGRHGARAEHHCRAQNRAAQKLCVVHVMFPLTVDFFVLITVMVRSIDCRG